MFRATLGITLYVFGLSIHADTIPPLERVQPPVVSELDDDTDLSGCYTCSGMTPASSKGPGAKYTGVVMIQRIKDMYVVSWNTGGEMNSIGVGMRKGDTLSVGWKLKDTVGITVYKINGKILEGHYMSIPGSAHKSPERLKRVSRLEDE